MELIKITRFMTQTKLALILFTFLILRITLKQRKEKAATRRKKYLIISVIYGNDKHWRGQILKLNESSLANHN